MSQIARTISRAAILTVLLTFGLLTEARADGFISPLIGFDFGGNTTCPTATTCEDKKLNMGVGLGTFGNFLGFEEEIAYAKNFFGDIPNKPSYVLTVMSNVMIIPHLGPLHPYVLGGVGLIKTHIDSSGSGSEVNDNNIGWDVGGGAMFFVNSHLGLRGEIRYFHTLQETSILGPTLAPLAGQKLDFGRAAAAVVLKF
mgnify:FL=1